MIFKREKFYDEERKRWVLRSTRNDGTSMQMTFQDEPSRVQQIMNYELIEFKLSGIGSTYANERSEGTGGQTY